MAVKAILSEKRRCRTNIRSRVSEEVQKAIVEMAYEEPAYGQKRVNDELRQRGYLFLQPAFVVHGCGMIFIPFRSGFKLS